MTKYAQLIANFQLAIIILMVSNGPAGFKRFFHLQSRQIKINNNNNNNMNKDKILLILNSIYKLKSRDSEYIALKIFMDSL